MKRLNVFERYLSLWVALCMAAGVIAGKLLPDSVHALQRMELGTGSQINIPIAVLIWLLAAAPCTAMVFVWSYLSDGDPAYTLVQVSINDLTRSGNDPRSLRRSC